MLKVAIYKCQFCNKEFNNNKECLHHELQHIGISLDTYNEWRCLNSRAIQAYPRWEMNDKIKKIYDDAIDKLVAFEQKNNISNISLANPGNDIPYFIIKAGFNDAICK